MHYALIELSMVTLVFSGGANQWGILQLKGEGGFIYVSKTINLFTYRYEFKNTM